MRAERSFSLSSSGPNQAPKTHESGSVTVSSGAAPRVLRAGERRLRAALPGGCDDVVDVLRCGMMPNANSRGSPIGRAGPVAFRPPVATQRGDNRAVEVEGDGRR